MKISLNWLKDYVSYGLPAERLAHKLTMAGLEVEKVVSVNGDTVFEIEITPNRPDCLCMLGVARETAAILNKPRRFPKIKKHIWPKKKSPITINDPKGCTRYIGARVNNVAIGKTQEKIVQRLSSLGVRSVNNIVDITNFVLMETGQPLHAFDYDKLTGGKIVVRRARKGEKIVTIDNIERALDPSILVIADQQRPVAIAGIMGGKDTEVTNKTKNILLESAYFDPILIRRASRKLGLSSDSSYRFERGVDFSMVDGGVSRAIDLIVQQAKGKVVSYADIQKTRPKKSRPAVTLSVEQFNERTGAALSARRFREILNKLDFKATKNKAGAFKIGVPAFRADVREAVDVIEEVARVVGYDYLPSSDPSVQIGKIIGDTKRTLRNRVRNGFLAQGFNEVITYTMINARELEKSRQGSLKRVSVLNPLTQDQEIMRPSMLPSLVSVLLFNINRGQKNIRFFETGKIYTAQGEREVLGIILTGLRADDWRQGQKDSMDFYDLKGAVEQLFCQFGDRGRAHFQSLYNDYFARGEAASVFIGPQKIGELGKVEERVLDNWGIKQKNVLYAQMDMEHVGDYTRSYKVYKPVSEFPAVCRDISLAVKNGVTSFEIEEAIRGTIKSQNNVILADLKFVEKYEGDKLPKGHTGLIYSLTYQSKSAKTLRDEEVAQIHDKVCDALVNGLGVIQR